MADKNGKIVLKDENNQEKEYTMLASFRYNGKYFILYTDYKRDEERNLKVFASIFNPEDKTNKVEKITDNKDKEFVEQYVKKLEQDLKLKMKLK